MARYSEAQNKASQKYHKANLKRIPLDVPVTEFEAFKKYCEAQGKKVNTVLREFMQEKIKAGN